MFSTSVTVVPYLLCSRDIISELGTGLQLSIFLPLLFTAFWLINLRFHGTLQREMGMLGTCRQMLPAAVGTEHLKGGVTEKLFKLCQRFLLIRSEAYLFSPSVASAQGQFQRVLPCSKSELFLHMYVNLNKPTFIVACLKLNKG